MRTRIRIGPFTFGKSGIRLSSWKGGTGFSIPLFNRNARSFGKIKFWIFSFFFDSESKNQRIQKSHPPLIVKQKKSFNQAYEPWTTESDIRLSDLYHQGKTVNELSEIFKRSKGAIRSRLNKLQIPQ